MQLAILALLVFTDQGRAFLLLNEDGAVGFQYLLASVPLQLMAYVRLLAIRPAGDEPNGRKRALAVWEASFLMGTLSAFLFPILIEIHLALSCAVPTLVADNLRGAAAVGVGLFLIPVMFMLIWRLSVNKRSEEEGTTLRDGGLLAFLVFSVGLGNRLLPAHRFLVVFVLLALVTHVLSVRSVPVRKAVRPIGGMNKLTLCLTGLWILAGLAVSIWPMGAPGGGMSLVAVLGSWMALAAAISFLLGTTRLRAWSNMLFLAFALWLGWNAFRPREARTTDRNPLPALEVHAREWLKARMATPVTSQPYPVLLAAGSGGGIRAAYWTAGVLCALLESSPEVQSHLFAISGVSGGAVGAGVVGAFLEMGVPNCRPPAAEILGGDLLQPTVTAMLTRDVISAIGLDLGADRAVVLEQTLEKAWREKTRNDIFAEVIQPPRRGPVVLFNATEVETAESVAIANVALGDSFGNSRLYTERIGLRLSTAVFLSARFPFVSPDALMGKTNPGRRLIDGGFADNAGTGAIERVLRVLAEVARETGLSFKPIVVLIENEPEELAGASCGPGEGGWLTPLTVLDRVREAKTRLSVRSLEALVREQGGVWFDGMRPRAGEVEFPLGWYLPNATRDEMNKQIEQLKRSKLADVAAALSRRDR